MGLGFQEQHRGKKAPRRRSRAESEKAVGSGGRQPFPHPSPRTSVTVGGTWPLVRGHKLLVRRQEETQSLLPEGLLPLKSHWLEP